MSFQEPWRMMHLLSDYRGTWMVAGGWAIDLYLNRETRGHQDIEIAIPRAEQLLLQDHLVDCNLRYVLSGQFYPWEDKAYLNRPIHEIHGINGKEHKIEILLNEIEDETWFFRRNLNIKYPLSQSIIKSTSLIPILAPEIVLLYKAKWLEPKDESDFLHVLPMLNQKQRNWLVSAIVEEHGTHPWLDHFN